MTARRACSTSAAPARRWCASPSPRRCRRRASCSAAVDPVGHLARLRRRHRRIHACAALYGNAAKRAHTLQVVSVAPPAADGGGGERRVGQPVGAEGERRGARAEQQASRRRRRPARRGVAVAAPRRGGRRRCGLGLLAPSRLSTSCVLSLPRAAAGLRVALRSSSPSNTAARRPPRQGPDVCARLSARCPSPTADRSNGSSGPPSLPLVPALRDRLGAAAVVFPWLLARRRRPAAFEAAATVLTNWGSGSRVPPAPARGGARGGAAVLAYCAPGGPPPARDRLRRRRVGVAAPRVLLRVLAKDDWLVLWDHLSARSRASSSSLSPLRRARPLLPGVGRGGRGRRAAPRVRAPDAPVAQDRVRLLRPLVADAAPTAMTRRRHPLAVARLHAAAARRRVPARPSMPRAIVDHAAEQVEAIRRSEAEVRAALASRRRRRARARSGGARPSGRTRRRCARRGARAGAGARRQALERQAAEMALALKEQRLRARTRGRSGCSSRRRRARRSTKGQWRRCAASRATGGGGGAAAARAQSSSC